MIFGIVTSHPVEFSTYLESGYVLEVVTIHELADHGLCCQVGHLAAAAYPGLRSHPLLLLLLLLQVLLLLLEVVEGGVAHGGGDSTAPHHRRRALQPVPEVGHLQGRKEGLEIFVCKCSKISFRRS